MPNVDAAAAQRVINDNWVLEGKSVAERAASWYRLGASPISAKAAVKREIEALPGGADVALRFWQSGKIKNEAIEAGIVAEIARLEQVAK